ncbi:MAG: ABC transporter ATP-binding protein [Verrucomicrobia bacterium]|nr:ABC transporter ATP-binding protein [Verrucomicrobiota bacterium]
MSRTHLSNSHDPTLSAKARSNWETIRRVSKYLKPYRWMAVATITCAILSLAAAFVFPKATGFIIDEVINARRYDLLTPTIAALIGAFFLRDLFNSLRIRINNTFEQNVIYDMRREVYGKLQRLPVGYFDQRSSGDLMTRVIEDVNSVERLLIDGTEQGVVAVLSIFGVLAFLFMASPLLAMVALIPIPLLAGGALWYTLTAHKRYRVQRKAASAMNALLMDNLQGVRTIKAFNREPHEDTRFAEKADDLRNGSLVVMRAWAYYSPAMTFCTGLGAGLVLWLGGSMVIQGEMKIGELTAFLLFLAFFYEPISKLHGLNQMLQSARAAGERVFDILDFIEEREQRPQAATKETSRPAFTRIRGDVVYEHVSFGYGPERIVLKDVNLHARPGEMIALVGPTGAGKSTIVNLLPAFYLPSSGKIRIDGNDVSDLSLDTLRAEISIVSQEAFLFNGTIRENILYGRLDATEEELFDAAKAANCHEFIMRLPGGYDSRVGERGVKLSVGEKQRVSIARALLKDAPILILDEATASVDTATEKLIQEALERLMANRTSFVIAHRLSTVRNADQILVLRHGEIVERGRHEELLQQDGLYAKLAKVQNIALIEEGFEKLSIAE